MRSPTVLPALLSVGDEVHLMEWCRFDRIEDDVFAADAVAVVGQLQRPVQRGDEIDLESYLFVTQIIDRKPSTLSSGIVIVGHGPRLLITPSIRSY